MKHTYRCSSCGAHFKAGRKQCPACGVVEAETNRETCEDCGVELIDGPYQPCRVCGAEDVEQLSSS